MTKPLQRWSAGCLSLSLLLGAAPVWPAAPVSASAALRAELLDSAQRWSDRNRTDVARQMIAKLLAVEPDSPEGLAFLGDLALRENKVDEARKILSTLQTRQPLHPATRELRQLVAVYSTQREKLARMRLTARAGRTAEAAVLANELFPEGPPRYSALGPEIARITGQPSRVAQTGKPLPSNRSNATATARQANAAPATGRKAQGTAPASVAAAVPGRAATRNLPARTAAATASAIASTATKSATQQTGISAAAPLPAQQPDAAALARLDAQRADALRAQADEQIKAERLSPALRLLEDALKLTPDDPWLRYSLARIYLRLQLPMEARSVMDQGVARAPEDTDMRYARALTLAALDDDEAALADLHLVTPEDRSPGMQSLEQRLTVNLLVAQADPIRREASLRRAEDRAGNDADLLRAVANAWFRSGQPQQGVAVLQRRLQRAPAAPLAVQLDYAQLLNRARDDATLSTRLTALLARDDWNAADRAALLAIHVDHSERQIEQAMLAGNSASALTVARAPLPAQADANSPTVLAWRQQAQARLLLAAGDYNAAAALLEQALRQSPDDVDMRLALGNARYQQGQLASARTEARWLQTRIDPTDLYRRLALLRLLQRTGETAAARAESQALLARYPTDVDVLLHAARLERSNNQYADALGLFKKARQSELASLQPAQSPDPVALDKMDRDIEGIEARGQAWIEVGQRNLEKNSTEGLSSLRGWERPIVAWLPWNYDGKVFAHVDPVQLDAGRYAGGDPFAQPGTEQITRGVPQRADGVNLGVGYQGDNLRWDIGEIGVGFAVRNWVGGLRYSGDLGAVGYNVEASRRPLTGTLLSYAGTADPTTGDVWGGVVATGVGGRLSRDFGPFSTAVSASVASLTGQNVADNSRVKWRVAADRDVYRTPLQVVNVGLALSGLHHEKDLSGYTWGHGGYYSPVRNFTVSLPVEWTGREGMLTWQLKGSVSMSDSTSGASDYYPTHAAFQRNSGQVYEAGASSGTGWAASGTVEYQVTRQLAIGAQLEREVADYYTPMNMLFYARFFLDPVREPLVNRPRPVQAYSQF